MNTATESEKSASAEVPQPKAKPSPRRRGFRNIQPIANLRRPRQDRVGPRFCRGIDRPFYCRSVQPLAKVSSSLKLQTPRSQRLKRLPQKSSCLPAMLPALPTFNQLHFLLSSATLSTLKVLCYRLVCIN
jgi:hypothetical protein